MRSPSLLAVFAHPDDEAFAAAGLIARCARSGARVTVGCATRGEAGRVRGESTAAVDVGARRADELAESCRALGADAPRFFGLADGRLEADHDRGCGAVAALIDEVEASAVVTLGPDGAYGHRDHLACTRWVDAAAATLPGLRVLHAVFPTTLFRPVWRALRDGNAAPLASHIGADDLGGDVGAADLHVRLDDAERAAKLAAISAHRSQLRDGEPRTFLPRGIVGALLATEWFAVASGPPLPSLARDPFGAR